MQIIADYNRPTTLKTEHFLKEFEEFKSATDLVRIVLLVPPQITLLQVKV